MTMTHAFRGVYPPSTAPETNFSPVAGGVSPGSLSDLQVSGEAWQGTKFGLSILWFGHAPTLWSNCLLLLFPTAILKMNENPVQILGFAPTISYLWLGLQVGCPSWYCVTMCCQFQVPSEWMGRFPGSALVWGRKCCFASCRTNSIDLSAIADTPRFAIAQDVYFWNKLLVTNVTAMSSNV